MDCPTCEAMVDAYLDGELSTAESLAFEQALAGCPGCAERLQAGRAMRGLLRALPVEPAPDLLRAKLERELRTLARPRPVALRRGAMAASLIVALGIGWLGGLQMADRRGQSDALVAGYLRVAMAEHAVDVASSDRHTVKPWYAGRIDYAPPVHDLTGDGFPLLGGRLDVLEGRKVAVLVYGRNQHKLALSLWPATAGAATTARVEKRDGFVLGEWRHAGFELRAVSDVSPDEMASFAAAVDRAIDADR